MNPVQHESTRGGLDASPLSPVRACALFSSIISNLRAPCDTSALVHKDIFQAPPWDSAAVSIQGAFFFPPKQTFAGARCSVLPGSSPNEDPPHTPFRRPPSLPCLASGHLSAGRNSRPCDSRVLAPVSQQGTRRCSGAEIHAQHSAGMQHSTASLLTGTHGAAFGGKKKMRRGARERSGGAEAT